MQLLQVNSLLAAFFGTCWGLWVGYTTWHGKSDPKQPSSHPVTVLVQNEADTKTCRCVCLDDSEREHAP